MLITERLQDHKILPLSEKFTLEEPHVSFDNHAYRLDSSCDRGEFADVLIHDPNTNVMIALEVKFLSNVDTYNDCELNLKRINDIKKKHKNLKLYFLLLIPREKWNRAKAMKNHRDSNVTRYERDYANKVGLLFWEELIELCTEKKVINFMKEMLKLVNLSKLDRKDRKAQ